MTFLPGHPAAFEVHAGVHARWTRRLGEGCGVGHPLCLGKKNFCQKSFGELSNSSLTSEYMMANISHSFVLNYEKFQQFDQHEEETKLWKWKLQIVSWVLFNKKAAAAEIGENYEVQDGGQVNLRWSSQGWCENWWVMCMMKIVMVMMMVWSCGKSQESEVGSLRGRTRWWSCQNRALYCYCAPSLFLTAGTIQNRLQSAHLPPIKTKQLSCQEWTETKPNHREQNGKDPKKGSQGSESQWHLINYWFANAGC